MVLDLIKHPKGNILFDTGYSLEVALNPEEYLGPELIEFSRHKMCELVLGTPQDPRLYW